MEFDEDVELDDEDGESEEDVELLGEFPPEEQQQLQQEPEADGTELDAELVGLVVDGCPLNEVDPVLGDASV